MILETTGMAAPGPVAQTFFVDQNISELYELDGIITLVDAKHVNTHLDDNTDEVMAQLAFADRIILNKADLIIEEELLSLKRRLQEINQMAGFYSATMADAPIAELLDIGGFNLERAVEMKPSFLEPEYPFEWGGIWQLPAGHYRFQLENSPDPDMAFFMHDVNETSEAAVLALAETVFVEFSKQPNCFRMSKRLPTLGNVTGSNSKDKKPMSSTSKQKPLKQSRFFPNTHQKNSN